MSRKKKVTSTPVQSTNVAPAIRKQSIGLYGSTWSYPNAGKYRNRYYSLSDTSNGLDTMSRELLVRWSRELFAQLPIIPAAVNALANFSIGDAYNPVYTGANTAWWSIAKDWLLQDWYLNCSTRGRDFDFKNSLIIESNMIDVDGDYLIVYGEENGYPKFQIIQNNRVRGDSTLVTDGQLSGTLLSDGVYYNMQGKPVAYCIDNSGNLVNNMTTQTKNLVVSSKDSHLVFDPRYIDKARGIPSIGSAILQALSIQELDGYLMEKVKIESTIALVEKNDSGNAPVEYQNTLESLYQQQNTFNPGLPSISPNEHAVRIVQGSNMRYVKSDGGDIKSLAPQGAGEGGENFLLRLETQVMSTIGVPHQLIYSNEKTGGRITSGIAEIFRGSIARRQKLMDKTAKFRVCWALAKAMKNGFIPMNDSENIFKHIEFTHPKSFSLDAKYDNAIITDNYNNGISSLNDATNKLYNRTAEETLEQQKQEQISFFNKCNEVAKATNTPVETIIKSWRNQVHPATSNEVIVDAS